MRRRRKGEEEEQQDHEKTAEHLSRLALQKPSATKGGHHAPCVGFHVCAAPVFQRRSHPITVVKGIKVRVTLLLREGRHYASFFCTCAKVLLLTCALKVTGLSHWIQAPGKGKRISWCLKLLPDG